MLSSPREPQVWSLRHADRVAKGKEFTPPKHATGWKCWSELRSDAASAARRIEQPTFGTGSGGTACKMEWKRPATTSPAQRGPSTKSSLREGLHTERVQHEIHGLPDVLRDLEGQGVCDNVGKKAVQPCKGRAFPQHPWIPYPRP